jgi:hypothetical protein
MKSINTLCRNLIIFICLISIISSAVLKSKAKSGKFKTQANAKAKKIDLKGSWIKLFNDDSKDCKALEKIDIIPNNGEAASSVMKPFPKRKINYYEKQFFGWGPSAFLFDYIDAIFQDKVVKQFNKIYESAFSIEEAKITDPYDPKYLVGGEEETAIKQMGSKMVNSHGKSYFNEAVWRKSISIPKVETILKTWNWQHNQGSSEAAREFVDKYDFNGDGRLSPKEFLIAMIRANKAIVGSESCENCMSELVQKYIDPIFLYMDCTEEEKANSEMLWNTLKKLQRQRKNEGEGHDHEDHNHEVNNHDHDHYNFFQCDTDKGIFSTVVTNDFVMKAQKSMKGYVNKSEFRLALLQGYWSRHVTDDQIYDRDTKISEEKPYHKNMKDIRWGEGKATPEVCNKLYLHNEMDA